MVSDAAATKAPIAKIADKVSGVFVPAVITIAIITTIGWLLTGETMAFALAPRDLRPRNQLSVCLRTCNAGGHYGGKRNGSKERNSL